MFVQIVICQVRHGSDSPSTKTVSAVFASFAHEPPNNNTTSPSPSCLPHDQHAKSARSLVLLDDRQGVQRLLLLCLGLNLSENRAEIRDILIGLRPFRLGEEFVLQAELHRAPDAVDAVVAVPGREAAERLEDVLVLLADQVVGPGGLK